MGRGVELEHHAQDEQRQLLDADHGWHEGHGMQTAIQSLGMDIHRLSH